MGLRDFFRRSQQPVDAKPGPLESKVAVAEGKTSITAAEAGKGTITSLQGWDELADITVEAIRRNKPETIKSISVKGRLAVSQLGEVFILELGDGKLIVKPLSEQTGSLMKKNGLEVTVSGTPGRYQQSPYDGNPGTICGQLEGVSLRE